MYTLPEPLAPLAAWNQFVCWFATPDPKRPGKMTKLPVHWGTGAVVDSNDPANWTNADNALAMAKRWDRGYGSGAGFVFTEQDPFFFLDIDGALVNGQWSALALDLCATFQGAAVEVSQSGEGLHIFGQTSRIPHRSKNVPLGLEFYTEKRFAAITGTNAIGNVLADCTGTLQAIIPAYFAPDTHTIAPASWTSEPVPEWSGPDDDAELIRRALNAGSKNPEIAFGGKQSFRDLWEGKIDENKRSEADQSLANHLAFWTGKNCERIERLMKQSALVRTKWDDARRGSTWLRETILKAVSVVAKVAKDPTPAATATAAQQPATVGRHGFLEYLNPEDQPAFFQNCFYIIGRNQIFSVPRALVLNKTVFDVVYGGHRFVFDRISGKGTDSAFDAFTLSRQNEPAMVDELCFRPELPPGYVVREGIRTYVNSYIPHECEAAPGDPSPFLDLLQRILPVESDREILINYAASFAQNPGVKFQWWPVIQGCEGNGKTAIVRLLSHIAGEHYTHLPNAHAMAKDGLKFNGWIDRKLFIGVEEIRLANKRDFLDEFKVIVTNDRIPIERKNVDAANADNRANGILMTNHADGVPITPDTRRYAIFYCAQQHRKDLIRDGMDKAYFRNFYDWFKGTGKYAGLIPGKSIMAYYLKTYTIREDLDPALGGDAPPTSSFAQAIVNSYGRVESEILEAIAEGRPGFMGGWVSSLALNRLFERSDIRAYVAHNKRRAVMQSLGYDHHPGLAGGRVDNPVMPDNGKPVLYVTADHPSIALTSRKDIADAYTAAQDPLANVADMQAVVTARFGNGPPRMPV